MRLRRQLQRLQTQTQSVFAESKSASPEVARLREQLQQRFDVQQIERQKSQKIRKKTEFFDDTSEWSQSETVQIIHEVFPVEQVYGHVSIETASQPSAKILSLLCNDLSLEEIDTSRLLYLDTETTGLHGGSGTLAFLIGLGWFSKEHFHVEQLMLSSPGQEASQLEKLCEHLDRCSGIVTFNGKRFDWPLLLNRFVLNRMKPPDIVHHIDLLHPARTVFRPRLGSVRLVNLEKHIMGFERVDDVEGSEIPGRFWEFVRTHDSSVVAPVLKHNVFDILAMAALITRLLEEYSCKGFNHDRDQLGVTQLLLKCGCKEEAWNRLERLAEKSSVDVRCEAAKLLAKELQRQGDYLEAAGCLESALVGQQISDFPDLALMLAKIYEHRIRDFDVAKNYAEYTELIEGDDGQRKRINRILRRQRKLNAQKLIEV
ncbi:MAG: ribonuclease H-like domain-containing protein [Myxococcota bacterium]|nr:ribonuclease H-like domain-containing protein [Myxococcota bacterium]